MLRRGTLAAALAATLLLAAAGAAADKPRATVVAGGDLMFDRGCRRPTRERGAAGLLAAIGPHLRRADVALANLECPLTTRETPVPKQHAFRCVPEVAGGLKTAGFRVLSLANNHSIDQGREALLETRRALEGAGLVAIGAGPDAGRARMPAILRAGPLTIAFLAYYAMPIEGLAPLADAPAPARLDEARLAEEVAAARRQADAVVVTVHWGVEHRTLPTATQERLGRALVDAGASLVLGHHPHVLQPIERYRDGVIAYSLGNLVFDQHQPERRLSAILQCELGRGAPACAPIPLVIDGCAPRRADPAARRRVEQLLAGGR